LCAVLEQIFVFCKTYSLFGAMFVFVEVWRMFYEVMVRED
jgi:hypothetical protein